MLGRHAVSPVTSLVIMLGHRQHPQSTVLLWALHANYSVQILNYKLLQTSHQSLF